MTVQTEVQLRFPARCHKRNQPGGGSALIRPRSALPRQILVALALLGAIARSARAGGPPFLTDDPDPVDFRHFEVYTFSIYDGTKLGFTTQGPALEVNWGASPNLQLHLVIPGTTFFPAGGPGAFGLGDTELGAKYRLIKETAHRPEIGVFPFIELPTGSPRAGLGNGRTWYRVPLWLQKSEGPWLTNIGGGEVFNSEPGMRNYPVAGWLLQRDLSKKVTLGGEIFFHGPEGGAALSTGSSTLVNFGGYYHFKNPNFQLLFSAGHSVAGQTEAVAYLGLYWTWGPASPRQLLHVMERL